MELARAQEIAAQVVARLAPYCERCEVAGSVRRLKPEVKDIEVVVIPRSRDIAAFAGIVNEWTAVKGKPTGKYTQRRLPQGIVLDLFMATRDNWGLIYAIRTGSADYSHRTLAAGWVKAGYKSEGGMLRRQGKHFTGAQVVLPEERDLFALIGVPWVEPEKRT